MSESRTCGRHNWGMRMIFRAFLCGSAGVLLIAGCGDSVGVPGGTGGNGGTGGTAGNGGAAGNGGGGDASTGTLAATGGTATGTGGPGGGGTGGALASCTGSDVLTGDVFNPAEVYLAGTLSEGACGLDAMAHWSSPDSASVGFDCYFDESTAQIRPTDGRLLYTNTFEDVLREFHCDGCPYSGQYPDNPLDDDPVLPTAPCSGQSQVWAFLLSPEGGRLHRCYQSLDWYDESGQLAYSDPDDDLVHLGYGDLALTTARVVHLAAGDWSPITGLPDRPVLTVRAEAPDRFLLALVAEDPGPDQSGAELWSVDGTGAATLEGVYPPLPAGAKWPKLYSSKLDGCRTLLHFASGPEVFQDIIVRRELSGASETVYDEAADPLVKIHISALVTGP